MEAKVFKSAILRINSTLRPYPTLFYFPGIRSNPFWDKTNIKSVKVLEDNYNIIKEEFSKIQQDKIKVENDYKITDHDKFLHKGDWEWYSYISKGQKKETFKTHFPKTYEILDSIEDKMIGTPFSYCFLSKLSPLSSISPHYGPCNIRLRIHLGIDIPSDCHIQVADKKQSWEEGKCLVFDDTYIHEVKNQNKDSFRTILLLDIWHPDILPSERNSIVDMFKGAYDKGWLKNTN